MEEKKVKNKRNGTSLFIEILSYLDLACAVLFIIIGILVDGDALITITKASLITIGISCGISCIGGFALSEIIQLLEDIKNK